MRHIKSALLLAILLLIPSLADAALTQLDEERLTGDLERISVGWDQPAIDSANFIFRKPDYTTADWERYFNKFFRCRPTCAMSGTFVHPLTDDLYFYLQHPLFWWFDQALHLKLQRAFIDFLWNRITEITGSHSLNLGIALHHDIPLRQTLFNGHRFFAALARDGVIDPATRTAIYNNYRRHILTYPIYFRNSAIDHRAMPLIANLRAQVWMALVETLPLTFTLKNEIATTIGLTGKKREIWNIFAVLVIDNNGLTENSHPAHPGQLDLIYNILTGIPAGLHNLRFITAKDFLTAKSKSTLFVEDDQAVYRGASGGVNISGWEIGCCRENSFPSDISPRSSEVFSSIVVHEINHVVDGYYISGHPARLARRSELLHQAGPAALEYLRSQVAAEECGRGTPRRLFFQECPQEFFASISNQYFTDSWHTLDLALRRFDAGHKEPLNQFLFFADTYTNGGHFTKIYTMGVNGGLTVNNARIGRDGNGRIVEIVRAEENTLYHFTLDTEGDTIAYHLEKRGSPPPVAFSAPPLPAG